MIALSLSTDLQAQQPPDLRFVHFSTEHGLSEATVPSIVEDKRGFMWFGTRDGLNRFDGYTFKVYRPVRFDTTSLLMSNIQDVLEDSSGNLWVAVDVGLSLYERDTDRFRNFTCSPTDKTLGYETCSFNGLYEDRDGNLWIMGHRGLTLFDRETYTSVRFVHDEQDPTSLSHNQIRDVYEDSRGRLWVGTSNGLNLFNAETGSFDRIMYDSDDETGLSHWVINDIYEDSRGHLWIGTLRGLNRFDPDAGTFLHYPHDPHDVTSLGSNIVDDILEDSRGNLWIATDGGGLNLFDYEQEHFYRYTHNPNVESSISSNVIRRIYEDSKGDLWIGNYSKGVDLYNTNNTAFRLYRHYENTPGTLSHNTVTSFLEDGDGTIWVGTQVGLNRFDREAAVFRSYVHDPDDPTSLSANGVLSLAEDAEGTIWVGTYLGGLNRFDKATGTFKTYAPDQKDPTSLANANVWDIFEDHMGALWVATFLGLDRFDRVTETFSHYQYDPYDPSSIPENHVWNIYEDRQNTLWVGTSGGIARFDREADGFRTYSHDPRDTTTIGGDWVLAFHEDTRERFWVATHGGGLSLFDRDAGTARTYRVADGLPNDVIHGILEDAAGNLWLSTNGGLSRFNPDTETFTNYSTSDWLQGDQFSKMSYMKTRAGEMFFGGPNGFNSFFPDDVKENPVIPPVVLTDFQLFNRPVQIGGDGAPMQQHITEAHVITLRHDQSVITFAFSALNFRGPEKNQYTYWMEGFDQAWSDVGPRRTVTYTNLDPGAYVFRVRGANNSGVWNEQGASVQLIISPPFWETWWFRLLLFVVSIGLVGLAYNIRTYRIRYRNRVLQEEILRREQVEQRLALKNVELEAKNAEVEAKNVEVQERNTELERYAYAFSHELKTPIVTIRGFLGLLESHAHVGSTDLLKRDVLQITDATDTMIRLLDDLLEMSRVGRLNPGADRVPLGDVVRIVVETYRERIARDHVTVHIAPNLPVVCGIRRRITELMRYLFDNALRFMGDQPSPRIEIGCRVEEKETVCYVRDNGIGIEPAYHDRVFQIFEQLSSQTQGTGIGLALAKRIVEVQGGRIWVESEGLAKGATFCFILPTADG